MARSISHSVVILLCGGLLTVSGCGKSAAPKAEAPPPAVTVAQPVVRPVQDYDEYTGQLMASEAVDVRARVKGYLTTVGFKDGDEVKKGQVLFQIDPRPFEAAVKSAQGQLDVVKARRVKADADVKRYRDLVPKGAATQQDLDKAVGELGEAEAGIRAAEAELERAQLDLQYSHVAAPVNGLASRALLTEGNLVGAGGAEQLLTTIMDVDPVQVYFDVDQRAIQQYRKRAMAQRAGGPEPKTVSELNIPFQFGLASEEGFPHQGVLDFIDNKVDAATGTISVRGSVPNPDRLFKPGFFARVRVPMGDKYDAVLVSDRSIGTQQGQKYVLVVDEKSTVAFRPVQLGPLQNDGLRVVTSGVKPEDRIVVNGIQRARPGTAVKPEPGQMLLPGEATDAAATRPVASSQ
jgi:membrane fusion protein, multidrug efflux system